MPDQDSSPLVPPAIRAGDARDFSVAPDWQPLPARGAWLAALGGATSFAVMFGPASGILARAADAPLPWGIACMVALLMGACGAYWSVRRHRRIAWKLDDEGFAVRRGNWWQTETRLPLSRVQHLDLKRGPLERKFGLSTLVVHTAGTRMAAVSLSGLDRDDAEYLRDQLARQLDDDAL